MIRAADEKLMDWNCKKPEMKLTTEPLTVVKNDRRTEKRIHDNDKLTHASPFVARPQEVDSS